MDPEDQLETTPRQSKTPTPEQRPAAAALKHAREEASSKYKQAVTVAAGNQDSDNQHDSTEDDFQSSDFGSFENLSTPKPPGILRFQSINPSQTSAGHHEGGRTVDPLFNEPFQSSSQASDYDTASQNDDKVPSSPKGVKKSAKSKQKEQSSMRLSLDDDVHRYSTDEE